MDVEEETSQPQQEGGALDSHFLQQFSCLGTTDHNELIKQLQSLAGGPSMLNEYAANFFLSMNNYNLGNSINSYFDLIGNESYHLQPQNIVGSTTAFTSRFSQSKVELQMTPMELKTLPMEIVNDSPNPWPPGTCLTLLETSQNLCVVSRENRSPMDRILLSQVVGQGEKACVEMSFFMPNPPPSTTTVAMATSRQFISHWQLCTPEGYLFGEVLEIVVRSCDLLEMFDQMVV